MVSRFKYSFFHSFLRSMTALLDPAQIEERERRRQKQIEHQVESLTSDLIYAPRFYKIREGTNIL